MTPTPAVLALAAVALATARALCADITERPVRTNRAGEPTEWDDRTTLIDVAIDSVPPKAWRALSPAEKDTLHPALCILIYGTPTPYGTDAVRHLP